MGSPVLPEYMNYVILLYHIDVQILNILYFYRVCLSCYDELAMQSAGLNNISKGNISNKKLIMQISTNIVTFSMTDAKIGKWQVIVINTAAKSWLLFTISNAKISPTVSKDDWPRISTCTRKYFLTYVLYVFHGEIQLII